MEEGKGVLELYQVESYVQHLQCFPIEEILSSRWIVQSCRLIQLSVQMALEAEQNQHQEVQHQILLHSKAVVLVWELVTTEAWRRQVIPHLLSNDDTTPSTTLPLQLVLQTEVTLAGILETLLFQEDSAASLDSLILDVIDWSVRQLTEISALAVTQKEDLLYSPSHELSRTGKLEEPTSLAQERAQILDEAKLDTMRSFLICGMRAVGLIQQVTLHRNVLPLCAGTRLLQNHDVPQLLATLIEWKPWEKEHKGTLYFFEGQWQTKNLSGYSISKVEVQIWLSMFSLLLDNEDFSAYEITSVRRTFLMKIKPYLSEAFLKELPALEPLSRFLSSLAVVSASPPKNLPLVTTLPQIGDAPLRNWQHKWEKLASFHNKRALTPEKETLMALASRFAAAYDLEALEYLLPLAPTCATCGEPAGRRCSRCRTQWYCRRSCQVSHWKKHRNLCDLVSQNSTPTIRKVIEDVN